MATGSTVPSVRTARSELALTAAGVLAENFPPAQLGAAIAPVSQTVYGQLLGMRGGDPVVGVVLGNTVAASGTAPTTGRFGIASAAGTVLAISGNINAAANWGVGRIPFAFSAPFTIPSDGGYFACFVVNGTWSVTQPTPARGSTQQNVLGAFGANTIYSFKWTGQTDLPAVAAPLTITTASDASYYMAFY